MIPSTTFCEQGSLKRKGCKTHQRQRERRVRQRDLQVDRVGEPLMSALHTLKYMDKLPEETLDTANEPAQQRWNLLLPPAARVYLSGTQRSFEPVPTTTTLPLVSRFAISDCIVPAHARKAPRCLQASTKRIERCASTVPPENISELIPPARKNRTRIM